MQRNYLMKKKEKNFLNDIAKKTDGYTGADLESLVREAALIALRESMNAKTVRKSILRKP